MKEIDDYLTIKSKSKLKDLQLKKELCFLFLSNAFAKMYIDETKIKSNLVKHFVFTELGKKSQVYKKEIDNIIEDSINIFNFIEFKEYRKRNKGVKNRFQKRLSFNEDGELEVHGLLFSVALILAHQNIKNRRIYLPYKIARDIYHDFDNQRGNMFKNARLLASLFCEYLEV